MPRKGIRNELGSYGESLATDFLLQKGYILIAKNLVLKFGEIDILMKDGEIIVIIEVKTQTRSQIFDPIYKIDSAKQRKLRLLASFIAVKYPEAFIRIDGLTISMGDEPSQPQITHYENIL